MTPEEIWRGKTDEEVFAATRCLDEYTEEGQRAIRDELKRRASSFSATTAATRSDESAAGVAAAQYEPTKGWRRLWPPVRSQGGAREAIAFGYQAAFLVAGITAVVSVLGVGVAGYSGLIGSVLYLGIGLGIRRRSRGVATLGLVIAGASILLELRMGLMDALLLLGLFNGVRGTFALARLPREDATEVSPPRSGPTTTDMSADAGADPCRPIPTEPSTPRRG